MPGLLTALSNLASLLEGEGIEYMVLGGFALPFYGRIRTTLDIDMATRIPTETDFDHLMISAREHGLDPTLCSYLNPVCVLADREAGVEVELWTRPDGIAWDEETLARRRKVTTLGVTFWVISPEDFIVSKLSRPDRSEQDELDVKSVLVRMDGDLDEDYLNARAKAFGVNPLLEEIKKR